MNEKNLTVTGLRDRLTQIIEENERNGWPERNELPVYLRTERKAGHGSADDYAPVQNALGCMFSFRDPVANQRIDCVILSSLEESVIQTRKRKERRSCGHCHSTSKPVKCKDCERSMCESCIQPSGRCGLCEDETYA